MKTSKILIASAVLATASAHGQLMPAFKNVDKDDDGVISRDESKSSGNSTLKRFFTQLDSNNNYEISKSEFDRLKDLVKAENAKKHATRAAEKKKKNSKNNKNNKRRKK